MYRKYIIPISICILFFIFFYFYYERNNLYSLIPTDSHRTLKSPGIILALHGGLGNQLFIYAAALSFEESLGVPAFLLPVDRMGSGSNIHSKRDYREIFKGVQPMKRNDTRLAQAYRFKFSDKNIVYGNFNKDELPIHAGKYIYIRDHYFQNYQCIKLVIPKVRLYLLPQLEKSYGDLQIDSRSSAFIHVRRGDFLTADNGSRLLPIDYYHKGLDVLNKITHLSSIYIISEDIDWCKNHNWNTTKKLEFFDDPDELKTLYMMSKCKAGAVVSNSTFSCWGAFLGAYDSWGTVVYPLSKAFLNPVPKAWTGIDTK